MVAFMAQSFLLGAVYQISLYYLPLFLQNARGYTIIESAAFVGAMVLVQSTCSVLSGQYLSRRKRFGELLWLGFGFWTLYVWPSGTGTLFAGRIVTGIANVPSPSGCGLMLLNTRTSSVAAIIVPLMLNGAGTGLTLQPTLVAIQSHTTKARRAVIISMRNFFRATGGACGLAVAAAVLQATLRSHLPADYQYLAANAFYLPSSFASVADRDAVLDAYMAASYAVFILQVPLMGVCLAACVFTRDEGLEPTDEREAKKKAVLEAAAAAGTAGGVVGGNVSNGLVEDKDRRLDNDVEAGILDRAPSVDMPEATGEKEAAGDTTETDGAGELRKTHGETAASTPS